METIKKNNEYHLTTNIIALSNASNWNEAKNEWQFTTAFYRDGSTCLCTKKDIMKVCVITNTLNNNTTEVGSCCVKKFMGLSGGDTVFTSILKLRKNIKSNITKDFFFLLEDENFFIDEDERRLFSYMVFGDIMDRYRKFSSAEWNQKIEINKRILEKFNLPTIEQI